MPMLNTRMLNRHTLSAGDTMALSAALDVGDFTSLDVVITVDEAGAGDAPLLELQHAACNEDDGYLSCNPSQTVDLSVAGKTWIHLDQFTRFLRWSLSGALESSATVTIDVVARR